MSPRGHEQRLRDILDAAEEIQRFAAGMTLEQLGGDVRTLKAVLYNFTVIGEAARALPEDFMAMHPTIEWQGMRSMRNVVVHVYFGVDAARVLQTIQEDLPPLIAALRTILGPTEQPGG